MHNDKRKNKITIRMYNSLFDVLRRRVVRRATAYSVIRINICTLVHADVVNVHLRGENEVLEVLSLEGGRHAKVHNEVLINRHSLGVHHKLLGGQRGRTKGSSGINR